MEKKFANNQVTLTTDRGKFSEDFVKRAVAFALEHGLQDDGKKETKGSFILTVHTPIGPILARPMADVENYPGFWVDWEVDGEYIALSTSEYQVEKGVFVTHEYADFSDDSPSNSVIHYYDKEDAIDAKSVLQLLRGTC